MKGVHLGFYSETLHRVPEEFNSKPLATFDPLERMGKKVRDLLVSYHETEDFEELAKWLPVDALGRLTFDEVCKIRHSSIWMMSMSVEEFLRKDQRFRIMEKIKSSMWRWGWNSAGWNEMVDAYESIRAFSLHDDFEVRFDFTTGCNEMGYSEHSRTYLDGSLAFLVYHRGEHVMTLGFSLMGDRNILIHQVQTTKKRGNRWLFRLPKNYLEFVLDRFAANFPGYKLHLADGGSLADKNIKNHSDAEEIAHLKADRPRLAAFYANSGRWRRGEKVVANGLAHYVMTEGTLH